jgi:hypothetical protein
VKKPDGEIERSNKEKLETTITAYKRTLDDLLTQQKGHT